jgi:hypothetical protein
MVPGSLCWVVRALGPVTWVGPEDATPAPDISPFDLVERLELAVLPNFLDRYCDPDVSTDAFDILGVNFMVWQMMEDTNDTNLS